jgi:hypothetical protein
MRKSGKIRVLAIEATARIIMSALLALVAVSGYMELPVLRERPYLFSILVLAVFGTFTLPLLFFFRVLNRPESSQDWQLQEMTKKAHLSGSSR